MEHSLDDQIREIKHSFRSYMNGVTAQSMRDKGLSYFVNWGIQLPHLTEMAKQYGKDERLAIALWKENTRECKILATMIMPSEKMQKDMAELWMEQMPSQEIAEIAVFNLFQYLSDAPILAFQWIARSEPIYQIAGFNLIARLFVKGQELSEMGINEYLDQAGVAISDKNISIRKAALNSLIRFSNQGSEYAMLVRKALPEVSDMVAE